MKIESIIKATIESLDKLLSKDLELIPWSAPIISFGSIKNAKIATLGLNPSNREFVNKLGKELKGKSRRFHTLESLSIKSWSEIEEHHINSILDYCNNYFLNNPYDLWFKKLDHIISGTQCSYYFPYSNTCHLDLVPYATMIKWGELNKAQQDFLIDESANVLGRIVENSSIRLMILNGRSVINNFSKISDITFHVTRKSNWDLPRQKRKNIKGFSFIGYSSSIGNTKLSKEIIVIGFNHNIQSSYGLTNEVKDHIRDWITKEAS
ncbi:MAG: hypothetical protein WD607_06215 [Candidatus Paceibacterota bacterium]